MLWCSQVAPGNENALTLRVYGDKGGLEWAQEDPNYLWHTPFGEPKRLLTRGGAGASEAAAAVTRIPGGHPEGYLEGFATIYAGAAQAIRAAREGRRDPVLDLLPGGRGWPECALSTPACGPRGRSGLGRAVSRIGLAHVLHDVDIAVAPRLLIGTRADHRTGQPAGRHRHQPAI